MNEIPTTVGLTNAHLSKAAKGAAASVVVMPARIKDGPAPATCQVDLIESEGLFKAGDNPKAVLEPFFEEVYDKCGLDRPAMPVASQ